MTPAATDSTGPTDPGDASRSDPRPSSDASAPGPSADVLEPAALLATIRRLARPRLTGSEGAREVETGLQVRFRDLGYDVRKLRFSFSTLPGRYGLPAAGLVLTAVATASGWGLLYGRPGLALSVLSAGLVVAALPLLFLDAALRLPWGRVETANLLFTRATPRWIVMAHRDSKSQGAPTAVRTVALAMALAGWVVLAVTAVAGLAGTGVAAGWVWLGTATMLPAAVVLIFSVTGNASPGALDNATGLAAVLALASRVPDGVAFLVTDGEELGLAGARAVTGRLPEVAGIINLDGLDDDGAFRIAEGRAGGRRTAAALATALLETARARGEEAVRRPLPPFVMVDHEPLARAGLPALTVLRGGWRSLLRVHRSADTANRLTGAGAVAAASVVLATLTTLDGGAGDTLRRHDGSGHSPPP